MLRLVERRKNRYHRNKLVESKEMRNEVEIKDVWGREIEKRSVEVDKK